MEKPSDFKTEFKRRLQAQIADALESVDFNDHAIQPGLHLRHLSPVSMSWTDRINTLQRVELMRKIVASDGVETDRNAA